MVVMQLVKVDSSVKRQSVLKLFRSVYHSICSTLSPLSPDVFASSKMVANETFQDLKNTSRSPLTGEVLTSHRKWKALSPLHEKWREIISPHMKIAG